MTSTALQALTASTGNRKDTWNTPVEFVGDVIKFLVRLILIHVVMMWTTLMFLHSIIIQQKLMV